MKQLILITALLFSIGASAQHSTIRVNGSYNENLGTGMGASFVIGSNKAHYSLGGGVGFTYFKNLGNYVPFFGEVSVSPWKWNVKPVLTGRVGYGVTERHDFGIKTVGGLYSNLSAGVRVNKFIITGGADYMQFNSSLVTDGSKFKSRSDEFAYNLSVGFTF